MSHTPGLWRVGTPKGFNASIVYVDDGKEYPEGICSVIGVPLHSTVEEVEKMGRPEYQEALATARLIAAAPELLELVKRYRDMACQVFFSSINDGDPEEKECGENWKGELGRIDAVLAKVRGEE